MANVFAEVPHALGLAHRELADALDSAAPPNFETVDLPRRIERFVDALGQIPGAQEELRRRATLVETRCDPESDYATSRARSLASYRGQPRKLTGSKLAITNLRKSSGVPIFLAEVAEARQQIERVLNERKLKLSTAARSAWESWRSACRDVQRKAEQLEVDGCWHLLRIHEAGEDNPSDRAECAKALIQTPIGGAHLEPIKAAADSLVDWVKSRGALRTTDRPTAYGDATSEQGHATALREPEEASSTNAPDSPKSDAQPNEGQRKFMEALKRKGALSRDKCCKTSCIWSEVGVERRAADAIRRWLKSHGYIETQTGAAGGVWLTEKGQNLLDDDSHSSP